MLREIRRVFEQAVGDEVDLDECAARLLKKGQPIVGDMRTMAGSGESEGSSTRSLLGTYEYMSPEQKRGADVDARSDIYAVGATLFACLAGMAPQSADMRTENDRYVSATRIWAGKYSRAFLQTIDWCLELDPLMRPQSVFALQKVLQGQRQPVVHRDPPLWMRLQDTARRWLRRDVTD